LLRTEFILKLLPRDDRDAVVVTLQPDVLNLGARTRRGEGPRITFRVRGRGGSTIPHHGHQIIAEVFVVHFLAVLTMMVNYAIPFAAGI